MSQTVRGLSAAGGAEALPSAGAFRLTARRGQFPFLPELGSRLYQLGREKPSAREALALNMSPRHWHRSRNWR